MKTLNKLSFSSRWAIPVAVVGLAATWSPSAQAFAFMSKPCGNLHWAGGTKMNRDSCTMTSTAQIEAYHNARQQWWDTGRHVIDGKWKVCSLELDNGLNETGRVVPSVLGSALGRTTMIYDEDTCEIEEADITMAANLNMGLEDESFWGYDPYTPGEDVRQLRQGRVALLHEWGHLVGLGHSLNFNVMRNSTPLPLSGGQPQPAPDDAAGIRALYPGLNVTNLYVSAQYRAVLGGNSFILATPNLVVSGPTVSNNCITISGFRGQSISVRYTVMNNGTSTVTNSGLRIFLNDSPFNGGGGTTLWSGTATINANSGFTEVRTLTIPSNAPVGLHWILWQIDTGNTTVEYNEGDNSVHSCMTVNVQ